MDRNYDVCIIGAGVIGACTAFEFAKNGWKTIVLDKLPEAGYGSTSASCAIIRTYYSAFETCALAYEAWYYWKNWASYLKVPSSEGLVKYHNTGCLVIKTPENNNLEKVCETMDAIGCPYYHVATKDIVDYLPGVNVNKFSPAKLISDAGFGEATGEQIEGAVFFPNGGYVSDPKLSAQNVQKSAEIYGAEFEFNKEVTAIRKENGRVLGVSLADGGDIDAEVVLNVGGPHSGKINKMAGLEGSTKITTRPLRHEVAHVPAPHGFNFESQGCILSDSDIATYARPDLGNNILIGSEDPECDVKHWVDDPDDFNENFSNQWKTMVMRLAQRLPSLGIPEQAKGVVSLYDVTEDWMPIYDKSDLSGFYMAIGTSGNQFKNAPVVGKLMLELVKACETGRDHDSQSVSFHLENINKEISLKAFSRNREINMNSSFSVIG